MNSKALAEIKSLDEVKASKNSQDFKMFIIPKMMSYCPKVQILSLRDLHDVWLFISFLNKIHAGYHVHIKSKYESTYI